MYYTNKVYYEIKMSSCHIVNERINEARLSLIKSVHIYKFLLLLDRSHT